MSIFKIKKENIKEILIKKPFGKRLILMLIGVLLMGVSVSLLRMCSFGTDPYAAFCYGIHYKTGINFGTVELIVNFVLLLIVVIFDVSKLGFGTLGNMILVGYTADFTSFLMMKIFGIDCFQTLSIRIVMMIAVLAVFVFAVSLYINAGLGGSAYDSLPYIIHKKLCKLVKREFPFAVTRIMFDACFTVIAFIIQGEAGIITVLMVFTLGPVIDLVAKLMSKYLKIDNS